MIVTDIDTTGWTLVKGGGHIKARETKTACVMEMVAALRLPPTQAVTDTPPCVAPELRAVMIRLNDGDWWASDEERTRMLVPRGLRCVGTAGDGLHTKRAMIAADHAVRVFAPVALEACGYAGQATMLRACRPIADRETALAGRAAAHAAHAAAAAYADVASRAADAAAYAAAAAAAYAAAAANAAAAAADAAAHAAHAAAADAADAAAYAAADAAAYADAAAARRRARNSLIRMLDRMLSVKS